MKKKITIETPEGTYGVSTVQISKARVQVFVQAMTIIGDQLMGNEEDTGKDFETMLFFNGRPAEYPFGDLPGNDLQGVFQRHATKKEAKVGHREFAERVLAVLTERGQI